jgi:endonuclease/exonuclease/phosphatase family metal-dependent hydrolase
MRMNILTHNLKLLPHGLSRANQERSMQFLEELSDRHDIIALQEVFDEQVRSVLDACLRSRGYATSPRAGGSPWKEDSGLFTATRFPIRSGVFTAFDDAALGDSWAQKGVTLFQLEHPGGVALFMNTHLQASSLRDLDLTQKIRESQIAQIMGLLRQSSTSLETSPIARIAAGDFNISGDSDEYRRAIVAMARPTDAYRAARPDHGFTWDGTENLSIPRRDKRRERLDYILSWTEIGDHGTPPASAKKFEVVRAAVIKYGTPSTRVSDHFGVEVEWRAS